MALRSRKEVLVPTVPIPKCHLWSTDGYRRSISYFFAIRLPHFALPSGEDILQLMKNKLEYVERDKEAREIQLYELRNARRKDWTFVITSSCLIKKMSISFWIADDTFILWVLIL